MSETRRRFLNKSAKVTKLVLSKDSDSSNHDYITVTIKDSSGSTLYSRSMSSISTSGTTFTIPDENISISTNTTTSSSGGSVRMNVTRFGNLDFSIYFNLDPVASSSNKVIDYTYYISTGSRSIVKDTLYMTLYQYNNSSSNTYNFRDYSVSAEYIDAYGDTCYASGSVSTRDNSVYFYIRTNSRVDNVNWVSVSANYW